MYPTLRRTVSRRNVEVFVILHVPRDTNAEYAEQESMPHTVGTPRNDQ
jgi:hypothetical protein